MNQLALPPLRRKIADTFSPEVVVVSDNDGEKESILPASILNDVISTEINKSSICIRATKSLGSLKDVNTPAIRNEDIYRSDTPQIRHQLKDQEPQFKRRRFQRRNSATAAMLFSQMQGTNFTQPSIISTEIDTSSIYIGATNSLRSLEDVNKPAIRNDSNYRSHASPQIQHQSNQQEPQFKRRRFQRRNSATAAMLFSQMQGTNFTQPTCPEEDQISKIIADSVIHGISRGNCDFACIDEDQDQPR